MSNLCCYCCCFPYNTRISRLSVDSRGVNMPGLSIDSRGVNMPGLSVDSRGVNMPRLSIKRKNIKLNEFEVLYDEDDEYNEDFL